MKCYPPVTKIQPSYLFSLWIQDGSLFRFWALDLVLASVQEPRWQVHILSPKILFTTVSYVHLKESGTKTNWGGKLTHPCLSLRLVPADHRKAWLIHLCSKGSFSFSLLLSLPHLDYISQFAKVKSTILKFVLYCIPCIFFILIVSEEYNLSKMFWFYEFQIYAFIFFNMLKLVFKLILSIQYIIYNA